MEFSENYAIETYKSLISIAGQLLRSLILLNGGAVIALLTYIGHAQYPAQLAEISRHAMIWFVIGLALSVIVFVGSYLTQLTLYNESVLKTKSPGSHIPWLWSTISIACLSVISFILGALSALNALSVSSIF